MTAFPSLQDLHVLRSTSAPPDTATRKTVQFIYVHPDSPAPLHQPFTFSFHPQFAHDPAPWASSFFHTIQSTVYHPTAAPTLACLTVDEVGRTQEAIMLLIFQGPPYTIPQCSNANTCIRSAQTCYASAHAIAVVLNSSGEIRNANAGDKWVTWNWFRSKACAHAITHLQNYDASV
ncbi:MAG: hypothetical protein NXY57DRAFT_1043867 [Lentinula lateritia]|nr:MAG: hypothetical protein NXY57DRAFT_1043867 [Lentinula lateritia]